MMIELTTLFLFIQQGLITCSQYNLNLLMPNVSPKNNDTLLCFKYKVDQDQTFITKFLPNATNEITHHMFLVGCNDVVDQEVWNCDEMSNKKGIIKDNYVRDRLCRNSMPRIIYAWAKNAQELSLPKDVAFKVGRNTDIKYLVLQVHYNNVEKFLNGGTDNSGVILTAQDETSQNVAGVYFINTDGNIAPNSVGNFEAACQLQEEPPIYPFGFGVHTHKLGLVNSVYVIKTDPETGEQNWIEIGRKSPQLPLILYPVTNQIEINQGDILAARCTMNNYLDHVVQIGPANDDEMCQLYIMYYVKGDRSLENDICLTAGPPKWSFGDFETFDGKKLDLSKIPDDISKVPADQENGTSTMHVLVHESKK